MHTAVSSNTLPPMITGSPTAPAPSPSNDVLAFPASIAQQVFWYLELLQPGVTAFNVPMRFRLEGALDPIILRRSLETIVERHEALRTHFEENNGELLQIVEPSNTFDFPQIDLRHLPQNRITDEADRLGSIEAHRPFNLATGPLFRAELLRLADTTWHLHVTAHHALFDGWSMTVLTEELATIYQAFTDGKPCPLQPLAIQYGDFSVWQKEFLESPEMARQLAFWKEKLRSMQEVDLPTDHPRPAAKSWKGDLISTLLPKSLTNRLQAIATRQGASLYHLLLAAYKLLLHRYSGSDDIAVGSPITGRTRAELEPIIGVFINSLILRSDLSGDPSFSQLVTRVRDTALEALENQDIPFECLVRAIKPPRDQSRNPLFQINFTHQRSFAKAGNFAGVELIPIPSRSPGAIFDLHLFMVEREEGWRVTCDFSTALFERTSAQRILGHFQHLLESIADAPEKPISQLAILTENEQRHLLGDWLGHSTDFPRDSNLAALFTETAHRFPKRIALTSGGDYFTYQQVLAEATAIALDLRNAGVLPGDRVALLTRPSANAIIGLLGILLAGAAFMPLDPDYPAERIAVLLADAAPKAILAPENLRPASWSGPVVTLANRGLSTPAELPHIPLGPDSPAYLLYTSGSTGKPKGVLVPHRAVARLVRNNDFIRITQDDVFLQAAPLSFDASTLEIFGPLLNGGRLVVPPHQGLDEIARAVRENGVTILWLTAGLFQVMIDEHVASLKGLKYLLAGGDVLSPSHVRQAIDRLPGTTLVNGYGPTENTTFTTCHTIRREDTGLPSIPIGKPIANTRCFILDPLGRPVPAGIPGELHTGGDGLALAYLNDPSLTAEKFITPADPGVRSICPRLYRTGDLCRWMPDGTIEFIGRRDHQVKVRGHRIELGEIEARLSSHPDVRQAKVAVRGETAETKRILAWVQPRDGSRLDEATITSHLAAQLPTFMRPDAIGIVETFPVNANGKIQTSALPDPGRGLSEPDNTAAEPPATPAEKRLAAIWSSLLGVPEIHRTSNFFHLGGHSLMALRMFSRITREFGRSLPLSALLEKPTLTSLASLLEDPAPTRIPKAEPPPATTSTPGTLGHLVTLNPGTTETPLFCLHGGDGGVIFYRNLAERLPKSLPIHAIESLALGQSSPIAQLSVRETAADYIRTLLAKQPHGPYRLAGYSFGGVVAHEMACQLTELGHSVEFLGLFDTHCPTAVTRKYSLPERLSVFWKQHREITLPHRIALVAKRIRDGIRTNRRVKNEILTARQTPLADPFSDLRRVQVREENWRAMQAHTPCKFKNRITLFKTSTLSDKVEWPSDYGWTCFSQTGVDIVPVSGEHLTLFDPDHIPPLAEALTRSLNHSPPH